MRKTDLAAFLAARAADQANGPADSPSGRPRRFAPSRVDRARNGARSIRNAPRRSAY
ncbi:hypothetical protein [Streptomyces sp. NBC_00893]|uniref:hypothetical protein n=1 Tax=Streptomyces sp. NBC_00893 TaxID=2975862 RepID=UPI0022549DC3|nr:hypothetical protein [Streptomyces sp. NBC_00893]MCX4847063.1 hypothetical protein [Streptomyces sp. NBC_00893]